MGRLYIAANVFAPKLIRPAQDPDDYAHDDSVLHMMLQPLLLTWKYGPDPEIEPLSIADYFKDWATPDPNRPAPLLVGKNLAKRIGSGEVTAIPVPLPPCVSLVFTPKIHA